MLDAVPTGLVLVTGLDPASTALGDRYWHILDEAWALDLGTIGVSQFIASQDLRSAAAYCDLIHLARNFTV